MSFMRSWEHRSPTPPARQAKIDTIKPLVERRGYQFHELIPSKGNWKVEMYYQPESIDVSDSAFWSNSVGTRTTVESHSFESLAAIFAGEIAFAEHIHHLASLPLRQRLSQAMTKRREAIADYSRRHGYALDARLTGNEDAATREQIEIGRFEAEATRYHGEAQEAQAAYEAYRATVPTTEAEASAYLAMMPRIKDRPKKER